LIHSHGYYANYLTYLLRLLFRRSWARIPVVITCHGWVDDTLGRRLQTWLDFATYRIARFLITDSLAQHERLQGAGRPLQHVPNGVWPAPAPASEEGKRRLCKCYGIPPDRKVVGAVGRLCTEKRFDAYLAACRELAARANDVHFLLAGGGKERPRLERLVRRYSLGDRFTFTGLVPDLSAIYQGLAVLVLTSDTEGTPRVILEGMAHGVPVVATRVGGVGQMVEPGVHGYLVGPGDAAGIARYTALLLGDECQRRRLGAQGRYRAEREFRFGACKKAWKRFTIKSWGKETANDSREKMMINPTGVFRMLMPQVGVHPAAPRPKPPGFRVFVDGLVYMYQKFGGINTYFNEVLPRVAEREHTAVSLFLPRLHVGETPRRPVRLLHRDVLPYRPGHWKSLFWDRALVPRINSRLRKLRMCLKKPCVFHSTYFTYVGPTITQVATAYDMNHELFPQWYTDEWGLWLREQYREYLGRATRIIAISAKTKADVVRFYG